MSQKTDFGCRAPGEVVERGEAVRTFLGVVGVRNAAADDVPPFVFGGAGGGLVGDLMTISSSPGHAMPAAAAAFLVSLLARSVAAAASWTAGAQSAATG